MLSSKMFPLLSLLSLLLSPARGFCPHKCDCDNDSLQVTCFKTDMEVGNSIETSMDMCTYANYWLAALKG